LFSAGFHARTSAMPGEGVGSGREQDQASGFNTPESFARYDRASSSWRMFPALCDVALPESSEIWPRRGTMRDGKLYRLPALEPPTSESGSSSWPTPDTQNHRDGSCRRAETKGKHNLSLHHAAAMWPTWQTPKASDGSKPSGGGRSDSSLPQQVKNWPTPRANDAEKRGEISNDPRNGLPAAAKNWPSPTARDAKGADAPGRRGAPSLSQTTEFGPPAPEKNSFAGSRRGLLNPAWVEALMGWPIGFTELDDQAEKWWMIQRAGARRLLRKRKSAGASTGSKRRATASARSRRSKSSVKPARP